MRTGKLLNLKTLLFVFTLSVIANNAAAQNNVGIFFQAVARDNFSNPAKSRKIYVQSSVIQTSATGTKVLIEEHQTSTDATGMFSISVGNGTRIGGAASGLLAIDWSNGPFFLNLKIAITPVAGSAGWDYTKEFVDMGTTSFGAVPYALYAANAAGVNQKLNIADTAKMLSPYAKSVSVQNLSGVVDTKLAIKDTLAMLAPYARVSAVLDSGYINAQLKSKVSLADSGLKYVTPAMLAAKTFDSTAIYNQLFLKASAADMAILTNSVTTNAANITAETNRATAAELALSNRVGSNTSSITTNTAAIATEVTRATAAELVLTNGVTTNAANISAETNRATAAELALSNRIASNTASITANTIAITAEAARATAAELALTNNGVSSNTASITANTAAIAAEVTRATAAELALTNSVAANTASITANTNSIATINTNVASNTASITANASAIAAEVTRATAAELALTNSVAANTASITANTNSIASINSNLATNTATMNAIASNFAILNADVVSNTSITTSNTTAITGEVARATASELALTNSVASNTASTSANATAITAEVSRATAAELLLSNNIAAQTSTLNLKANASDVSNSLSLKANTSDLTSGLALKLDANQKGVANGVASLNSFGIIPSSQLPPVSLSSTNVVASDADMIALSNATVGSIAIRTDVNKNYVLNALPSSTLANWVELLTPAAPVQAVNGYTGSVNLLKSDIGLGDVDNTSDANKPISSATQSALDLKANTGDLTTALSQKMNTSDANTALALKINTTDANALLAQKMNTSDANVALSLKLDANKVGSANGVASLNALGKVPSDQIPAISFSSVKVLGSQAEMLALSSAVIGSVVVRTDINKNYVLAQSNPAVLSNWIELLTPAAPVQSVNGYSGNITISKSDLSLGNVDNTTDLSKPVSNATQTALDLKANLASPTFTGIVTSSSINAGAISATSVIAPTYASTPKTLTYSGSTINWNPSQGLNAAITLTQNSTLSFTSAPPVGSNGTIVLTQDATGNRTITLPAITGVTNRILGSTSTSTIALSTAANAKDILDFYYDGGYCYWKIGQGYGIASSGGSGSSNLSSGVTGTLSVANGGTGVTTLSGLVKGNGSGAMTAATAGVDYVTPVATFYIGTTPITHNRSSQSQTLQGVSIAGNAATATIASTATTATTATNATNALNLTGSLLGDVSGTQNATVIGANKVTNTMLAGGITVAKGGTGASTLTGYVKGNGTSAMTASSTIPLSDVTGAAPLASPTFTGTVTAPLYASAPQTLTDGSTISWNPNLGLNASVTLGGDRTLSFSSTPAAGSYGTLVITQDATGGRNITLPSTANKILGSTSTTTIALSTAGGAKDILNFYYDGTNCFWSIGQGYGLAASSSATNLASGVTGTLPVANGGTGVTTLTGLVKGNGTSVMTAAVAGTDYQAPISISTTGTGAATLSGTTLNIPTPTAYTLTTASASTLGGVKIGNNLSIDGSGVLSANINSSSISGTVAVSNGGTGVTSSTGTGSVVLSASPALTGTPTAPTATSGDNTTQIATTAFVTAAVAAGGGGTTYTTGLNSSLGGYVFYVTPNGKHGLVAETNEFDSPLYNANDKLKDPTYHSTDGKNFMDWRVPTLYELTLMYNMKTTLNMNNSNIYWSSTWWGGYSANSFFNKRMSDGVEYDNGSDQSKKIKAVRTF